MRSAPQSGFSALSPRMRACISSGMAGRQKTPFILHKHVDRALRFDLNPPSRQEVTHEARTRTGTDAVTYELLSLPLYAIGEPPRLLGEEA